MLEHANYQQSPSTETRCATCKHASRDMQCETWGVQVRPDYICDAWESGVGVVGETGTRMRGDESPRNSAQSTSGVPAGPADEDPPSNYGEPPDKMPIQRLAPGSALHTDVLHKLRQRLDASEEKMSQFYPRWRTNEMAMQAYINLPKYAEQLRKMNDEGKPPQVVEIQVPYIFAAVHTMVTYMMHTFGGRKPIFQLATYKKEWTNNARAMEMVLQYNADHTRLLRHMYQWFWHGFTYGVGIVRTNWKNERAVRTRWVQVPRFNVFGQDLGGKAMPVREDRLIYSGNDTTCIDPFMFFPDPRVPMHEVNRKGEFVFWRTFLGHHEVKAEEFNGVYMHVDAAKKQMPISRWTTDGSESVRALRADGDSMAGYQQTDQRLEDFYQVDQGTVTLIPKQWGLGNGTRPEKWIFTILNKDQIVQAEPLEADHDMHPVAVIEPYSTGPSFGSLCAVDVLKPIQDLMSWLVNSHMENVRVMLNNMLVADPSAIELQDLKEPGAGKIIRLKMAAYGRDVRSALNQLNVQDVTRSHLADLQLMMTMGHMFLGINENLMGLQADGGRKTATEVRTAGESGASRMASLARIISAQGMVDLVTQMVVNIQQRTDEEFLLELLGEQSQETNVRITQENLAGDFHYPIHDGTLPLDRVALMQVWRELAVSIAQDPELRQTFNLARIVEYVAELGGARNIDEFKMQVMPPGMTPPPGAAPMDLMPPGGQMPGMPPAAGPPMPQQFG